MLRVSALLGPTLWALLWSLSAQAVPPLINYSFTSAQSKTIHSTSTQLTGSYNCTGTMSAADQIDALALVTLDFGGQGCYTNGDYNNNDYLVERGTVTDGGSNSFIAYRVHEPTHKANQWLGSRHGIYYRFPAAVDYSVYLFASGAFSKVAEVSAANIDTGKFVPVPTTNPLTVSEIIGENTYVFVPSSTRVSNFPLLAPGVEGALLATTPFGNLLKYRYTVADTPFDTVTGYVAGPDAHNNVYSFNRQFFPVEGAGGGVGVLWQDEVDLSIQLTWFGANLIAPTQIVLPNSRSEELAAATDDAAGNFYYLTIQAGSGASTDTARTATLYKVGGDGTVSASVALDTSKTGLNMVSYGSVASLTYVNGKVGLILGRTMHKSTDGLNHQGAIAVVFDGTTLALDKNWGQTSGHSFESLLTGNGFREFVGIDLGDNYPRGVNLHKFDAATKKSRVVHTFKTLHATTSTPPGSTTPLPVYYTNPNTGVTYYKWSNDNKTYTELGGVAETTPGYTITFVGEPYQGKTLDNGRAGGYLNDPRNIGLVTVREDFENATGSGNQVSDDLVLTNGAKETGGFYTFGGTWSPQRNAGVVWLTNYPDKNAKNASRLKMAPQPDGNLLLIWEIWTPTSYVATKAMKVTPSGAIITPETDLGSLIRLNRRDDPLVLNRRTYLVAGNKTEKKLELIVIEPTDPCSGAAVTFGNRTFANETYTCTATSSITAGGAVTVTNTADVSFFAPRVILQNGFAVRAGGKFRAKRAP